VRREASWDRVSVISLLLAIAAVIGLVIASPTVLPRGLRELVGLGPDRVADAPSSDGTGSYKFIAHQQGDPDQPVGYDPCKKIAVRVNLEHAPDDGLEIVEEAMARIEQATGLRFDYQGTTDQRPQWDREFVPTAFGKVRARPVLVSWATSEEVPQLKGRVAGIGGSLATEETGGYLRYVTGGVTLDADAYRKLDESGDGHDEAVAIAQHEFGHLVGLDHVNDRGELMYPSVGRLDFGPGDLAGLAKVGSTPCA
jgi:hypothetical protein